MRHLTGLYWQLTRIMFADLVAYRLAFVLGVLTSSVPLASGLLWSSIDECGPRFGWGNDRVWSYFVSIALLGQLASSGVAWQINSEIRDGSLNARLLAPVDPLMSLALTGFASFSARSIWVMPVVVLVTAEEFDSIHAGAVVLFTVSVILAWFISLALGCFMGALAFFFTQAVRVSELWIAAGALASGAIVPLAFVDSRSRVWLEWLPFWSTLGAPLEVLASVNRAPAIIGVQLLWATVFAFAAAIVWRVGLRRYEANGA